MTEFSSVIAKNDYDYLKEHKWQYLAGFDEVGIGSIAGPVVSAGVILPLGADLPEIKDSKSYKDRSFETFEKLANIVFDNALECHIGVASVATVTNDGPLEADRKSMKQALSQFTIKPDVLFVDGDAHHLFTDYSHQQPIIKGESHSQAIAAASILATYMNYRIFKRFDKLYPQYDLAENWGYYNTTKASQIQTESLEHIGITPFHRTNFGPIMREYYHWPHIDVPTYNLKTQQQIKQFQYYVHKSKGGR